ncbi:MAG: HAD family hydrolase [Anaerolineales bacterium]|nr:HAD family hydrolase [Anaerolineales bacterium]
MDIKKELELHFQNQDYLKVQGVLNTSLQQRISTSDAALIRNSYKKLKNIAVDNDVVSILFQDRKSCRFGIVRSFTLEPLRPLFEARLIAAGFDPEVYIGDFKTYAQDLINPNSQLCQYKPDIVLLAVRLTDVLPDLWDGCESESSLDQYIQDLSNWISVFRQNSPASMIIQGFEFPPFMSEGIFDQQNPTGQYNQIHSLNQRIKTLIQDQTGVYFMDYASLVYRHGYENWFDQKKWLSISMPIKAAYHLDYVDEVMRFVIPLMGKKSKALVLDLDNTLWGGVIGEDGIEGIKLGHEYPGILFVEFQKSLLKIRERGILLTVCSKNNLEDALEVFDSHPWMVLKQDHLSAMRINWQDKSSNLREIAAELNIGLDSLVFVDDNPAERDLVRDQLPEVQVLELPEDPANYIRVLLSLPFLERPSLSDEDRKRNEFYTQQKDRTQLQSSSGSLEDFYHSLEQVVEMELLNSMNLARIAQLTQKTNQFNMTTKRYSEQDIDAFGKDPHVEVYAAKVNDRFGDNGIVGVVILKKNGKKAVIDTFLLSCRVIGRTVETAILAFIVQQAYQSGIVELCGDFIPTKKNKPAAEVYSHHGFRLISDDLENHTWRLEIKDGGEIKVPDWIHVSSEE